MTETLYPALEMMFMDSGAFSQFQINNRLNMEKGTTGPKCFDYYKTSEFFAYMDAYGEFLVKNRGYIDVPVTLDVIGNPELSWRNLKYLEKNFGIDNLLPVIHAGTDVSWVKKHIDAGYEYLGLSGPQAYMGKKAYYPWADQVFHFLCPGPKHLPIARTHGFAITAHNLLVRYPWWSVDSASWVKAGAFGFLYVPKKRSGKFDYRATPYRISVSCLAGDRHEKQHFLNIPKAAQNVVREWLEFIDVPLGRVNIETERDEKGRIKRDEKGRPVEKVETLEIGVINDHVPRKVANIMYYHLVCENIPKYPWPFKISRKPTLW